MNAIVRLVPVGASQNGEQVNLEWTEVPGAMGYQVWRHTSPWTLRVEITDVAQSHYEERAPPVEVFYKVTFFTNRTLAGGWAPNGDEAPQIPGWDESTALVLAAAEVDPARGSEQIPSRYPLYVAVGASATLAILGLVVLALRRNRPGGP